VNFKEAVEDENHKNQDTQQRAQCHDVESSFLIDLFRENKSFFRVFAMEIA
jgi:hypothetical protein